MLPTSGRQAGSRYIFRCSRDSTEQADLGPNSYVWVLNQGHIVEVRKKTRLLSRPFGRDRHKPRERRHIDINCIVLIFHSLFTTAGACLPATKANIPAKLYTLHVSRCVLRCLACPKPRYVSLPNVPAAHNIRRDEPSRHHFYF